MRWQAWRYESGSRQSPAKGGDTLRGRTWPTRPWPRDFMRKQYHSRMTDGRRLIWDVDRLVDASVGLPPHEVPLASIRELDEPYWFEDSAGATCREIAEHARLMGETDLRHPIILSADGRVMDGMHRVAKAYVEGRETITAVRFDTTPEPDYVDVDLDSLPYDEAD